MRRIGIFAVLVSLTTVMLEAELLAGVDQAEIYGTVKDSSSAVIPGAHVTAKNKDTGFTRAAVANEEGSFVLPALPVGNYEVTAQVPGFATQTQTGLSLVLSQRLMVNFQMQVSAVATSVTVEGRALEISLSQSQIGGNVTPSAVATLPLDGRTFVDLAGLVPGIIVAAGNPVSGGNPLSGGQQLRNKNLIIDGASEKEDYGGGFRGLFSLESVREFQVVSNRFSAESGHTSGSLINVVTKSGTNDLHGSAFGFFRNDRFDARNPVARVKPDFHRYQYGSSAGGPLVKDRTHFFGTYERQDLDSPRIVITPVFTGSVPGPRITNLALAKMDHQYLSKGQLSARYSLGNADEKNVFVGETILPSAGMQSATHTQSVVVNNLYTLSPSILNETTFQFARSMRDYRYNDPVGPMLVRPSSWSGRQAMIALTSRTENRYQVLDNFSWFRKKHSFKAGIDLNRVLVDGVTDTNFKGMFMWISDSPAARPFSYTQNMGDPRVNIGNTVLAFYFMDDWKLNSRLALNLGVRWDGETNSLGASRDWNNFAPRLGFAWDFLGKGKGSVRGGFGLFYDQVSLIATNDAEIYNGSRIKSIRISNPPYPDPFAGGTSVPVIPQLRQLDPDLEIPYSHQTSIGVEHEIFSNWVVSADYAFVRGVGLLRTRNLNPIAGGKRPDTRYADIRNVENSGNSFYHGLLMGVKKRMARRFELMASYTLSRARDENLDYSTLPTNNFNLRADLGPNQNMPKHNFVFNAIVQMPWGFEFSTITSLRSGLRYTITTGKDDNGDGTVNDRPSGVGRNSGVGPDFATVNVRLNKFWKLTERLRIETIFETFNLFNRANLSSPDGNLSSLSYGRSLAAADARQLQLAMRFRF